jgi:hypothetical protein
MKKAKALPEHESEPEMLPEYDFRGGVRGKHAQAYRAGHTVKVRREDGSVVVQYFTAAEGAVLLEPDVREFFPDAKAVNQALRSLIALIPDQRDAHRRARRKVAQR